jgi:hypothetical protein
MGARPIRPIDDHAESCLKGRARNGMFSFPIYGSIDMIESARSDRIDKIILRNMDDANTMAASPCRFSRPRRTHQDNQATTRDGRIGRHITILIFAAARRQSRISDRLDPIYTAQHQLQPIC